MEPVFVSGSGTETGQIIVTSIGGGNGQSKQVSCVMIKITALQSFFLCCNCIGI